MTKLKLFIFICFCALSTITQAQYTLTIDDVRFSNGQITDYTNATEKSIIIPDNFDGVDVTSIEEAAFQGNQLTQVSIPNSVKSIGKNAFASNQLTEVIIPNSVNSIGYAAFYGNQLTEVSIGNSVTSIGYHAFSNNQLTEVIIPNSVTSIGNDAFDDNQLTEVSIPNSVTSIGEGAFSDNTDLTSFNLPTHHQGYSYPWSNGKKSGDEITNLKLSYLLDENSKGDAVDFTIIYTLDGGTNDANNPADYTVETATITLADASKTGRSTFKGWYSDAAFTADNEVTEITTGSTGDISLYAKYSDEYTLQLSDVTFSDGQITDYANTTEKNIIIPDNFDGLAVETIGKSAFYESKLTQVSIPNSVKSIGESAFDENNLTEVSIPNSVTSIGDLAFYANKLTEVSIPNSVESIGNNAFRGNKLAEVIIGNSVLTIGDGAFQINKLTEVIIPNSVESIGKYAFYGNQLAEVSIPNSVKSIGNYAFRNNLLTQVSIPNSVKSIGASAFRDNQLTQVSIPNSVKSIGKDAFGNNNLTKVSIPNSVTSIGEYAFRYNQLTEVSIPNSVTSIGKNAFNNNTGLTLFNLPTHYQGYSYSWSNGKKSGDEITDFALSYELDEDSKGDAVDFTITYTLDGGTNAANNPADYTVETATITLAEASKDGYTFGGWYSDAAFTADNEVTEIATGSTGPKEFFAKFSETYNITYTLDGGTNAANNPTDYTVETETIILAEASKDGYTFEGWYSDAAFTNQVTEIATGSTGDVVLFAKYSEIALGIYTTNIKVFNFYPNPSIDFIQTELEVSSLTIRSISGSKVKQFEGGSFFDISNLKSGVYILLAIDKNGDTYKSKLLKE